jgi:hypothetical protein
MPQVQREITIAFLDGHTALAASTGNNAAWLCACHRPVPLLGCSDSGEGASAAAVVECPKCRRRYRIIAPGARKAPNEIVEL